MDINDNTSFREVQETFAEFYPYLKIEFYRTPHKPYEGSEYEEPLDPVYTLGEIRKTHVSGLLEIQPWYKASDVEQEFQERFGLPVQIFKKEGDKWLETTGFDDFTLKELNELGRSSSDAFIISDDEPATDLNTG